MQIVSITLLDDDVVLSGTPHLSLVLRASSAGISVFRIALPFSIRSFGLSGFCGSDDVFHEQREQV